MHHEPRRLEKPPVSGPRRAALIVVVTLSLAACTKAFLRNGLTGDHAAELHGITSVNLGPFSVTTSHSNVPAGQDPAVSGHGGRHRRQLESDVAVVTVTGVCGDALVSAFAGELMALAAALHGRLGWEGQAGITVLFGAAPGVHRRHHVIGRRGAPKISLHFPPPPACAARQSGPWRIARTAVVIHELAHVISRGVFGDLLEDEAFAHIAQVCADFAVDGVVDSWPARLTLSDTEWAALATGSPAAWSGFVDRTRKLPASAAAAVLVTANFRAFSHPHAPAGVVAEMCDMHARGLPAIAERMIVPASIASQHALGDWDVGAGDAGQP